MFLFFLFRQPTFKKIRNYFLCAIHLFRGNHNCFLVEKIDLRADAHRPKEVVMDEVMNSLRVKNTANH